MMGLASEVMNCVSGVLGRGGGCREREDRE